MDELIKELRSRIIDLVELSVDGSKAESFKNLMERHSGEFIEVTKASENKDLVKSKFSNFINRTLSTVEALGLEEKQYKAIRKLILNEMNGCLDVILVNVDKKTIKEV